MKRPEDARENIGRSVSAITQGEMVMPGIGCAVERAYTTEVRAAMGGMLPALGNTTFDLHVNREMFGRNVPATV